MRLVGALRCSDNITRRDHASTDAARAASPEI